MIPPVFSVLTRILSRGVGLAGAILLLGLAGRPTCAFADRAVAWGDNTYGQLGNGASNTTSNVPVNVSGLNNGVTAISGGGYHSMAIQGGGLVTWGANVYGELGDGTNVDEYTPRSVAGLTSGVTAIAGGGLQSLAVQYGAAYAWGRNNSGQLGDNTTTDRTTPVAVVGLSSGVTAVAGGLYHSLAIQNGAAYAWGEGSDGQLGNNTAGTSGVPVAAFGLSTGVTAIAAGQYHSVAIKGGVVYTWGDGAYGQLGNGRTGDNLTPQPLTLAATGTVTAIAAGALHTLAVQNGNVYAWGYNTSGQLGSGPLSSSTTPVLVDSFDLHDIVTVAASKSSSYALSADGSLWVWGDNRFGELGLGSAVSQYASPQHLLPPTGFVYTGIEADEYGNHFLAELSEVPEPSTLWGGALIVGLLGLGLRRQLAA